MNDLTSPGPEVEKIKFTPISEDEMAKNILSLRKKLITHAVVNFKISDMAAEDLIGEVTYKALKYRKKYNPGKGKISTFLYRMLTNTFIDYTRSTKTCFNDSFCSNEYIGKEGYALKYDGVVEPDNLESRHYIEMLMKAIALLPDTYEQVLRRMAEGSKLKEIAEELDLPIGTVKARGNLARKMMAKSLIAAGLVDIRRLGRSAYMLDEGGRLIGSKTIEAHALKVSKMAQEHILEIEIPFLPKNIKVKKRKNNSQL